MIQAEKVDTVLGGIKRTFFNAYRTIMHSRIHYEHDEILNREKSDLITRMRFVLVKSKIEPSYEFFVQFFVLKNKKLITKIEQKVY